MVVAGFVDGGATGSGEPAWVAGAVVTGAVVAGVWAGAAVVDAAWVDGGDEPHPVRLPARIAAATMVIAIGNALMPHPLVWPARDEPVVGVIVLRSTRAAGDIQPSSPGWRSAGP
jgi:hypothetical protein